MLPSIKPAALALALGLLFAHQLVGFTLSQRVTTREVPDSGCTVPSVTTVFPTSAHRIHVWFLMASVVSTDEFSYEWVQPSGAIHQRGTWTGGDTGQWCYRAWLSPQSVNLPPGQWTVRILANGSPLFSLTFRILPTSEVCPTAAISPTSATNATLAESNCRVGDIRLNDDMRYARRYRLTLASSGVLRAVLSSSEFDSYLFLLNSNGAVIDEDDDDGADLDSKIVRHLDPGSYVLLVTSYRKDTGAFRLTTTWQDPQSCGVTDLLPTGRVTETLRSADCLLSVFLPNESSDKYARLYRLVVRQPGELTLDLTSSAFDTYLYLLNSRYGILQYNDDVGPGTDSRITYRVQPGTYYVVATTYDDGATGGFGLRSNLNASGETITLLLHGLNSDSNTWDKLNKDEYAGQCRMISVDATRSDDGPLAPCYAYNFRARKDDADQVWANGDGATFTELGDEVGVVVDWIRRRHGLKVLILTGHSRGGLAARAYLQQALTTRLPFRTGLVTIGTPHLGSPFGRIQKWLSDNGKSPSQLSCIISQGSYGVQPSDLRFAYAPSTGYLATSHDASKTPSTDDPVSQAIRELNSTASQLSSRVDLFGEVTSKLLEFGENVSGGRDGLWLNASTLIGCVAKDTAEKQAILDYTLQNLPDAWLNEGDGIVPFESQQILKVPGVRGTVWSIDLKSRTSHVDETSRTAPIKSVIDKVSSELGAMPTLAAPTLLPPVSLLQEEPHPMPAPESADSKRLKEFGARLPSRWSAAISESVNALQTNDTAKLLVLGQDALASSSSPSDDASQLALRLLRLAGTEKAVAAAFESLTAERGWTPAAAQNVAADFARLPFKNIEDVLVKTLFRYPPASPSTAAAAAALAQSGNPSAVRSLLQWARTLDEPGSPELAARHFRQIASTSAIVEFRKSLLAAPFKDEIVSRTLQSVLSEIDTEPRLEIARP